MFNPILKSIKLNWDIAVYETHDSKIKELG